MEIINLPKAEDDLNYWINKGNKTILKKLARLTESILQNPYRGIVKPEALKNALASKWSRRISDEHRYIYQLRTIS